MNIAIFFSGRIKGFQYLNTLNLIKEKYNPTFFCSLNEECMTDEISLFLKTFNLSENQYNIEKTIVPEILYTFRKHVVTIVSNTYSMFYHNKRCFDLIEKYPQKFDIIIRFRADIDSPEILSLLHVNPNTVYIPKGNDPFEGTINDQVAYGDFNTMKIYCEVVNNIIKFCNHKPQLIKSFHIIFSKNSLFHPETLMKRQLDVYKININRFDYNYVLDKRRYN